MKFSLEIMISYVLSLLLVLLSFHELGISLSLAKLTFSTVKKVISKSYFWGNQKKHLWSKKYLIYTYFA